MIQEQTIRRINKLTRVDLEKKTIFELLASATEEVGEFSRELKIEEKTFGNTYKEPDEGTQWEAVDIAIMGICLFLARGGDPATLDDMVNIKLDKWAKSHGT